MAEKEPYRPGLVRNQSLVQQLKEFQKNPRSLVFVALAENYRAEGLPHQALEIAEEGLVQHPGLASGILAKARCLFDMRRYGEASAVCQEALGQNPNNLKAHKLLAEIYVRLGQRRAAIRSLTKVVGLFPQDREAVKALEELENLETGQFIPVRQVARASVDSPPQVLGRIEEFQVGSFSESVAAIPPEQHVAVAPLANSARETLQELDSDGIVLPAQNPQPSTRQDTLARKAKRLERLLAHVRLLKREGA
jgi:tetratricopeptide (TPR) repeat protein